MERSLATVFAVLLTAAAVCAQQAPPVDPPASKQDIEKLMVALHTRERLQLSMEESRKQTKTMATQILRKELPESSEDELAEIQRMMDEMIDDIEKDYQFDAVLAEMVPIYQRHLTKSDSDQLIAFYSSPVGQKVLRELPAITSEAMQVWNSHLQPRLEAAIAKVKEKIEHIAEEDQKKKDATKQSKPIAK